MDPNKAISYPNASEHVGIATKSSGDCEDMPSLDVLTFEHELCTSQNCHCHLERIHNDNKNVTNLPPFAFRTNVHPPLKRPHASEANCTPGDSGQPNGHFARLVTPSVFGSRAYSKSIVNTCSSSKSFTKQAVGDVSDGGRGSLFGSKHCDRANFHSYSQLCARGADTIPESYEAYRNAQFQNLDFRLNISSELPVNRELDLHELHLALDEPAENVPQCPLHPLQTTADLIQPCTCAQQAAKFDDWTVDELAGYFDDFCHIPKKMSAMAEMMYM